MQTTQLPNTSISQKKVTENKYQQCQLQRNEEQKNNPSDSVAQISQQKQSQGNTLQSQQVINEKTICYLSSFDLNINDWFNDYENIVVFKMNMQQSLGSQWHSWIQSTLTSSTDSSNQKTENDLSSSASLKEDYPLFVIMINFYLIKFYGHEGVSTDENLTKHVFDRIYSDACLFLIQHCYTVHDNEGLRPLLDTFFRVAAIEYKKILNKIEFDQNYQCHLTEKALAEYNTQIQKAAALEQREKDLAEQQKKHVSQFAASGEDASSRRVGGYAQLSQYVPSLPIIRNNVIKPLLFAIERVVEQYLPPDQQQNQTQSSETDNTPINLTDQKAKNQEQNRSEKAITEGVPDEDTASQTYTLKSADDHLNLVKRKLKKMQISSPKSSKQSNKSLKKRTFKNLDRAWVIDDSNDNSDCIIGERLSPVSANDYRSDAQKSTNRRSLKLQNKIIGKASLQISMHQSGHQDMNNMTRSDTVTGSFSTNIFELNHDQLESLPEQDKSMFGEADFKSVDVIRFIKPNKIFYNHMMVQWLKFAQVNKQELECRTVLANTKARDALMNKFIAFASFQIQKHGLMNNNQLTKVIGQFAQIVIEEHFNLLKQSSAESGTAEMSICSFFVNVKTSLLWRWECDVVKKSTAFQKQASTMKTI